MSPSESPKSTLSVAAAVLLTMSLMSGAQAAPLRLPAGNNAPSRGGAPCQPFYRREMQFSQQCAPTQFARVWHVAPATRASTVVAITSSKPITSEIDCYLYILATGNTFQQFTFTQKGYCTYTAGTAIRLNDVATQPTSSNIIATNYAGSCASLAFSSTGVPGIPCQDVEIQVVGNSAKLTLLDHTSPYTLGQAIGYGNIH